MHGEPVYLKVLFIDFWNNALTAILTKRKEFKPEFVPKTQAIHTRGKQRLWVLWLPLGKRMPWLSKRKQSVERTCLISDYTSLKFKVPSVTPELLSSYEKA